MTEDDTFRKLTKPTFDEMVLIMQELHRSDEYHAHPCRVILSKALLEQYDWDFDEYCELVELNLDRLL